MTPDEMARDGLEPRGAGYRVYYLLAGGDKRTQDADISRAAGYLQDFKRRQK